MGQAIFGANNLNNPNSKVIGGSSMPREKRVSDTKLRARKAKSDVKTATARNGVVATIGGRIAQ